MEELVTLRNKMKAKKPEFEMQTVNVYPQNKGKWRKPRGMHSKMRRAFRGNPAMPSIGYGSPKSARHLTRDGSKFNIISSTRQAEEMQKGDAVLISGNLGMRKKAEVVKILAGKDIRILNLKIGSNAFLDSVKSKMESRRASSAGKKNKREKKEETKEVKKDEPKTQS